tara:strand:+ start:3031 stop:3342 length:312 start_codon:yes stop_codon:yes gene_type:complete
MLKLDKHLKYQVNHFHGSFFDFIYKCHEVLEHNQVINSFYKDACEISSIWKNDPEVKDRKLYRIAKQTVKMIDRHDIDLAEHLDLWLTRLADLNKVRLFERVR